VIRASARSKKHLESLGWRVGSVERFIPYRNIRIDLFGILDLVCLLPGRILGVQACAASTAAAHLKTLLTEGGTGAWLSAGGEIEIHSWALRGGRGQRKKWTVKVIPIKAADLSRWQSEQQPSTSQ